MKEKDLLFDSQKLFRDLYRKRPDNNRPPVLYALSLVYQQIDAFYGNDAEVKRLGAERLFLQYNRLHYRERNRVSATLDIAAPMVLSAVVAIGITYLWNALQDATGMDWYWGLAWSLLCLLFLLGFCFFIITYVSRNVADKQNTFINYLLPYEERAICQALRRVYGMDVKAMERGEPGWRQENPDEAALTAAACKPPENSVK